jgi:hypothetical protein
MASYADCLYYICRCFLFPLPSFAFSGRFIGQPHHHQHRFHNDSIDAFIAGAFTLSSLDQLDYCHVHIPIRSRLRKTSVRFAIRQYNIGTVVLAGFRAKNHDDLSRASMRSIEIRLADCSCCSSMSKFRASPTCSESMCHSSERLSIDLLVIIRTIVSRGSSLCTAVTSSDKGQNIPDENDLQSSSAVPHQCNN